MSHKLLLCRLAKAKLPSPTKIGLLGCPTGHPGRPLRAFP